MSAATAPLARFRPSREALLRWGTVLQIELVLVVAYVLLADVVPLGVRHYVYPFVWINVGVWAVSRVGLTPTSTRERYLAATIGLGYFLLVTYVAGLWALDGMGGGLSVAWLPPGWGPAVIYMSDAFTLRLLPFEVVGYAALAYLVAATVLDTVSSGVAGVVGLFSCVSCTWPLVGTALSGVFGGASVIAAVATTEAYGVSTLVFLVSVALLVWRPRLK